jgi:hypothetical protein
VSGSLDIPLLFISLLPALPESVFRVLFLVRPTNGTAGRRPGLMKPIIAGAIGFAIVFIALFIGRANKIGVDKTVALFISPTQLAGYLRYVGMRISSSYGSLQSVGSEHLFDIDLQMKAWLIPFESFLYRTKVLFGASTIRPLITSISRLNYVTSYIPPHHRAGASPGLLAASLYLPVFPLNVLIMALFAAVVTRFFDSALPRRQEAQPGIVGLFVLLYFFFPLCESPQDLMIVLDPEMAYLVLFGLAIYVNRSDEAKAPAANPIYAGEPGLT